MPNLVGRLVYISRFLPVLGLLAAVACSRVPPLANVHPTRDSLARAVLDAVERRDLEALRRLTLSEQEFRDHIWPELPAARPERNLPFSYVWGDLRQKSEASLQSTLAEFGGRRLELRSLRSTGEATQYPTYLVERRTVLTVVDQSGATADVRLFGSILYKDGGYKVFSFVID